MLLTIAWTALLMGLAGGPHCIAMCSAPCGALTGLRSGETTQDLDTRVAPGGEKVVRWQSRSHGFLWRTVVFHLGRLLGYSALGALAAEAMGGLAWLTQQTSALRPVWTLLHVAVLAWGLMMLAQARQPVWIENAGRAVWSRVRPLVAAPGGVFIAGSLWAFMPCGLLYSALLVAALSGGPLQGAITMALFAIGSGLWLAAAPWIWMRLRHRLDGARAAWGARLAGLMLCGVAAWALWTDLVHQAALWC